MYLYTSGLCCPDFRNDSVIFRVNCMKVITFLLVGSPGKTRDILINKCSFRRIPEVIFSIILFILYLEAYSLLLLSLYNIIIVAMLLIDCFYWEENVKSSLYLEKRDSNLLNSCSKSHIQRKVHISYDNFAFIWQQCVFVGPTRDGLSFPASAFFQGHGFSSELHYWQMIINVYKKHNDWY